MRSMGYAMETMTMKALRLVLIVGSSVALLLGATAMAEPLRVDAAQLAQWQEARKHAQVSARREPCVSE